jgi:1-acyl-sn-glycerol-3-phosphate acyltransferase
MTDVCVHTAEQTMMGALRDAILDRSIVWSFDRSGFLRHARRFRAEDLDVDLTGRVCLVTGANSGIGRAAATALAVRGADVYLLCRDAARGEEAVNAIRRTTGSNRVHLEVVDVSDLSSIRAFAERYAPPRVDVLIHNAGVLPATRRETPQGLELTLATNVVGPVLARSRTTAHPSAAFHRRGAARPRSVVAHLRAARRPGPTIRPTEACARMTEPLTVEESVWARWSRRAVTVPLYLGLGTLSLAVLLLTIVVALGGDAIRRTGHVVTVRCALGLTLYFVCEAAGIIASWVLWIAASLWPGTTVDRTVVWNLRLQRVWARTLFTGATRLFGMRVEVTGDEAVRRGPFFPFCRHASTLDTLLPAVFASNPYSLRLGHVMKRELLWDPCLDIVGQRTRNAFVRRGSGEREKEIALLRGLGAALGERDGVLLFPEGTRFSPAKRERALAHLADSGQSARLARAQRLHHVFPPRRGGALALLETRPDVDVAFLAHVGFEGAANLNDIWNGKLIGRTIRLCFWRVPSTAIPRTAEGRIEWLDTQ